MIDCQHLTKRYRHVCAVDDLTFRVGAGVVTGFLGPNGAGKSTTMHMILALTGPTSGRALVNGRPYRDLRWPMREVGAALDSKAFHPGRSARHHLQALAAASQLTARRVDEVLDTVGLSDVADRRAGTFSLGMAQRLGLAAALLGDPSVLVLDEPLTGLDPEGVRWVRGLLRSFASDGRTVLVSSHLLSEMAVTADHLVVIGAGRLLADTTLGEFVDRHARDAVVVRGNDCATLARLLAQHGGSVRQQPDDRLVVSGITAPRIGELALDHHIALEELTPRSPSLEDVFLEVTTAAATFHSEPMDDRTRNVRDANR